MLKHPIITNDNKRTNEQELLLLNKSGKCTLQHVPRARQEALKSWDAVAACTGLRQEGGPLR